jgi:hypothetical protein
MDMKCGVFFFLVSCGGVRLSPLGTSAPNWPIVPAPDDRWWTWSSRWNENSQGKPKYSRENLPHCHFVHRKSHMAWPGLEQPLSYGTALASNTSSAVCEILFQLYNTVKRSVINSPEWCKERLTKVLNRFQYREERVNRYNFPQT